MDSDPTLDRIAAAIREHTPAQLAPFLGEVGRQVADALRLALPSVGDAEIGAVLMVAATQMNHANDSLGNSLGARGVINPLLLLGERLYREGTAEPGGDQRAV